MNKHSLKQPIYLAKVLAATALLASLIAAAIVAGTLPLGETTRLAAAACLVLPFFFIYPIVWRLHLRADEMLQLIHYRACVFSVAASASVMGALGALQAMNVIGTLHAFYALICIVASWAVGIMLADRSLH